MYGVPDSTCLTSITVMSHDHHGVLNRPQLYCVIYCLFKRTTKTNKALYNCIGRGECTSDYRIPLTPQTTEKVEIVFMSWGYQDSQYNFQKWIGPLHFANSWKVIRTGTIPPYPVSVNIHHTMLISSVIGPTTHPIFERHSLASRDPAPISLNVNITASRPKPWSVQGEYIKGIWRQEFENYCCLSPTDCNSSDKTQHSTK